MYRKAQASMEFLMTYGWAILVVIAAIGTLAYFGVLSPDKFLPEKCTISPGIDCQAFRIDVSGAELSLRNGMGRNLLINSIKIGDNCELLYGTPEPFQNGELKRFSFTGCTNGAIGDRYRADLTIAYTDSESGIAKITDGTVTTRLLQ